MSDKGNVVFVEPKLFPTKEAEHFKFRNMECPTCEGGGRVKVGDYLGYDPNMSEPCQRCNGTGKLMMDVVIREQPDEPKIG